MIRFDETICRNLQASGRREWLETNGLGGFASSTICGMNTRRYHGLLVAATQPPVGRMVLLAKFEETLVIDGRRYDLSTNRYPGTVHPQGYLYLKQFRQDPFPVFSYQVEDIELERSIFMVHGENSTVVQYVLRRPGGGSGALELRPLIAFRDYHSTTHENANLNPAVATELGRVKMQPYAGLPALYLCHSGADVLVSGDWYRSFEYDIERERGLDFQEDLFSPCVLRFDLNASARHAVIASTEIRSAAAADALREAEIQRRHDLATALPGSSVFARALAAAADQFIVQRGDQSTVIAGYPWFSDWGRDTMIALPGLALATGRLEGARRILLAFAAHVSQGMLPNRFPDSGEAPEYNTVDATLWFFEAVRALWQRTNDDDFVRRNLYGVLSDIVSWHERGTRYGIRVDSDALLLAGEAGTSLTWMDARTGDRPVTPRHGKPVEVQALWYNALRVMECLSGAFGYDSERRRFAALAERAHANFVPIFWNEEQNCLFDVVDNDRCDAAIRSNQILAVSLFHSMLSLPEAESVVAVVERHLLTPYGLRTLAPSDPRYLGRYGGDPYSRDGAYHQGTVWPWLLGPFIRAYLRVNHDSAAARAQAEKWTEELRTYIENDGVGQIPEVFDGDPPHRAGGCIAQAWSVAELLRICVEDIA